MSMRMKISGLLRRLGLLRADFLTRVAARMPVDSEIGAGELVVVENGGLQKWACMKCPGGCGMKISLSLNANRRPRWGGRAGLVRPPQPRALRASDEPMPVPLLGAQGTGGMVRRWASALPDHIERKPFDAAAAHSRWRMEVMRT
jgi:hypothetical protein